MTTQEQQLLQQLAKDVAQIKNYTSNLGGSLEFKTIVQRYAGNTLKKSTKGTDTEDQAVDEGGAGTYNVLKEPDGFLEITINNLTYYLPYFS